MDTNVRKESMSNIYKWREKITDMINKVCCLLRLCYKSHTAVMLVSIDCLVSFSVSYRSDSLGIFRVTSTPSKTSSLERNGKLL